MPASSPELRSADWPGALVAVPAAAALLVVLERLPAREEPIPLNRDAVDADAITPDPTAGEQLTTTEAERSS